MIRNDAVILGLLVATLGVVFWTTQSGAPVLATASTNTCPRSCCAISCPRSTTRSASSTASIRLYFIASRYLLPATLVLLTLAIDLPATLRLGPKALAMFFAASAGVVIGGPVALAHLEGAGARPASTRELWRGMTAIAGSWIGGAANQAAMKEVFQIDPNVFGVMVAVDVLFSYLWMAVLLWMAANHQRLDRRLNADTSAITALGERMEKLRLGQRAHPGAARTS